MHRKLVGFLLVMVVGFPIKGHNVIPVDIEAKCETKGMNVLFRFNSPFDGTVYSKDHKNDNLCRYVEPLSNSTNFWIHIPIGKCGTEIIQKGNIQTQVHRLVFQHDGVLQNPQTYQCLLYCNSPLKDFNETLAATSRIFASEKIPLSEPVFSWMEIKPSYDQTTSITPKKYIHIGDELSIIVHVQGGDRIYSILVKNCEARDEELGFNSTVFKLSDAMGCPLQRHVFSTFMATRGNGTRFSAYARMKAFRFSQKERMFVTCAVELCFEKCSSPCDTLEIPQDGIRLRSDTIPTLQQRSRRSPEVLKNRDKLLESLRVLKQKMNALNLRNSGNEYSMSRRSKPIGIAPKLNFSKRVSSPKQYSYEDNRLKDTYLMQSPRGISSEETQSIDVDNEPDSYLELNYPQGLTNFSSKIFDKIPHANAADRGVHNIIINVTKDFSFEPNDDLFFSKNSSARGSNNYSFPKLQFLLISIAMLFLTLCLLLSSVLMCLHIRREKKKRAIDRFLLYSYY